MEKDYIDVSKKIITKLNIYTIKEIKAWDRNFLEKKFLMLQDIANDLIDFINE